jgi:hypothetical protein
MILIGLGCILWVIGPMVTEGYPSTHSTHFNLSWSFQYQRQFFSGQFYPRWLEFSNFGYGNATFAFYPPMCMVATLPFRALGLGIGSALVASMGLATGILGLGLYLYARLFFPAWIGLGVMGMGMVSPYFLIDMYQRGAIGEVWAIATIPWIFWGTQLVITFRDKLWPIGVLALTYGVLVLSHPPTLLLFTLVWIFYPPILAPPAFLKSTLSRCCAGAALALGWTAFYLWPAALDQRFIQVEFVNAMDEYQPQNRLMVQGLLQGRPQVTTHWFDIGLTGIWWVMVGTFALASLLAVLLRPSQVQSPERLPREPLAERRAYLYWLGVGAIALLMMTDILGWSYRLALPLQRIQFSWRWMGITTILLPLVVGYFLNLGRQWFLAGSWWLAGFPMLLCLTIVGISAWQGSQILQQVVVVPNEIKTFENLAAAKIFPNEPQKRPGTPFIYWHWIFPDGLALVDVPEYRAREVVKWMPPLETDPLVAWVSGSEANLKVEAWTFGHRRFTATNTAENPQAVVLRTFYYPAWRVRLDGRWLPTDHDAEGAIMVAIPPGTHGVDVDYLGTATDWIGRLASVLTVIGSLWAWHRFKQG